MTRTSTFARRLLAGALVSFGLSAAAPALAAEPLQLDVYNPGHEAIFPVTSVLVSGKHDAILIDAQFGRAQAEKVVEMIRASGKQLTAVYISHGDPDFYFGLEAIKAAYPDVKVLATKTTIEHIEHTRAKKLAFWGPKLGKDAPATTIVPQELQGDTLKLEGQTLQVRDLKGPQPDRSYVWIPSIKAVVGGVVNFNGLHVWMADTQSDKSQLDWLKTLDGIAALKPKTVIPGHYAAGTAHDLSAVTFTRDYIKAFRAAAARAQNSAELIAALKAQYPQAGEESSLELSAKVAKGEMKW
ncbi:MBL fold metallo-hydrolase [Chitinilyticum litopenaei]|uniref:MBL fold metallo-hydrolase n=1 Tax=Chitinilyticum litopenaei TaxID=1121276 RepID=UPI000400926C|nr:MBL fold metallo-hydrolase [Chitinilyticum litopenaei]